MPLRIVLGLLVVAALMSGCGGKTQLSGPEFEDAVVNTRDRADFAFQEFTKAESIEDLVERMRKSSVAIEDAANDLGDVEAPEEYEPETTQLVDALDQLSVDIKSTADQIEQTPEILSGTYGFNFDSWDDANKAIAGLAGKGIQITVLQRHAAG